MENGRILLTGGTGFVGRRVLDTMLGRGWPVTAALRRPADLPAEGDLRIVQVGDLGASTDWRDALVDVEAVVHLAAHVHVAPERAAAEAARFDDVNRRASLRLFQAAAERGVRLFVFASSITVLGGHSEEGYPFDDATAPRPETPYARSKLAAEDGLRERAGETRTRLVILRPPLICGPGVKGNLGSLARLAALPVPLPLGRIRNRRTLLSLDNLASAIATTIAHPDPPAGTFALGDEEALSTSEIVSLLREGAGRWPLLLPAPVAVLRRLASVLGANAVAKRLFGSLEVDSRGFRDAFGWTDVVDTASTLRATGAALRAAS